jgi:hypothetical protein
VEGSRECGDEHSGSNTTELVMYYNMSYILSYPFSVTFSECGHM